MYKWLSVFIVVFIVIVGSNVFAENLKPYPKTRTVDVVDDYFGVKVKDPYRWLENTKSKEVQDWIEAQNKYTDEYMKNIPQVGKILERLEKNDHFDEDSVSEITVDGKKAFFWRRVKSKNKRIYYVREIESGKETLLLDLNNCEKGVGIDKVYPSNTGKYIAYEKSKGGDENSKISIMEVKTGKYLSDYVYGYYAKSVSWLPDDSGFYYMASPETPEGKKRYWNSAFLHRIGERSTRGEKVFGSKNVKTYFHVPIVEKKGKYVIIYRIISEGQREIYFKKIGSKDKAKAFIVGKNGSFDIRELGEFFYVLEISEEHPCGIIYKTPINKIERKNWEVVVPEKNRAKIEYFYFIGHKLVIKYLYNASNRVDLFEPNGKFFKTLKLPSLCSITVDGNWDSPYVLLTTRSFVDRKSRYKYNIQNSKLELIYRRKSVVNYKPEDVITRQIWYKSKDGTKISMFIVYKKNIKIDKNTPVLIRAYGAYNIPQKPRYYLPFALIVEANGIFCMPNLRGGGEYGMGWYNQGKLRNKQNTIDDLIAASEWLIKEKQLNAQRIGLFGLSAGGIAVGGAITQRPELYKAVYCGNPVLDMLRFPQFGFGKYSIKEFGNPKVEKDFKVLYSYSPYHNIQRNKKYPAILISCAENDTRTGIEQAIKTGARFQTNSSSQLPILIQVKKDSGHRGTSFFKRSMQYFAQQYGFLFNQIGVEIK